MSVMIIGARIYETTTTTSKKLCRSCSKLSYLHHVGREPLRAITVGQQLEETAKKHGYRTAVVSRHQKKTVTFQEALNQADKLAAGLKALSLEKKDRVGLWAPNLVEWYVTKMACARAGLVLVALNPAYQPPEIEYCIKKVGIKAMVCADKFKTQDYYQHLLVICPEIAQSEPGNIKSDHLPSLRSVVTLGESAERGALNYGEVLDLGTAERVADVRKNQSSVDPDDPCNIQFTSGTTGHPKAALTSHFNQTNNGFYIGKRNELDVKHHKICVQVPLFHAFGVTITTMASLCHGATMVFPADGYSPDKSLDAIKEERCTIVHGTPTMYVDLVHRQEERKEDIAPEIAVCGGALCSPHLFKQMLEVLKVQKVKSVYGLSETTAVVFQSLPGDDEVKSTSTVGHVVEHVEAKVVDAGGKIVPVGTPGELCVRGYPNMLGYWEDDDKTKEMIGADGWLKTGDQFVLTEDGYGKIVGRLKEMIIRGGENIFPREIEDFLNTHPDVLETHVVGLPHERLGEEVCACVRLKPGKSTLTHQHLVEFCKGKIAHFKIPSQLRIVQDIPKTMSGKVQKFKLVEIAKNTSG